MSQKSFNAVAGVVFAVVAVLHLVRFLCRGEVVIGGWVVPVWASIVALVVSGYLALSACKLSK